jgi:hypothetical protein
MPGLLHDYLKQATEGRLLTRIDSRDLERLRLDQAVSGQRRLRATSGGAVFFSGALMTGLDVGSWHLFGLSAAGLALLAIGALLLLRAHLR